jgi:hypothetical protein
MRTISLTSVVVDYFNVDRTGLCPSEADPILIVDPDAVLTLAVSTEYLETVAGRHSQVVQDLGLVKGIEFPRGYFPKGSG